MNLRFGIVSEMNFDTGLARVEFQEDGIVSQFLPVLVPNTNESSFKLPMSIGEHVACVMDERSERGVILGAIYSKAKMPFQTTDPKSYGVKFADGTTIEKTPDGKLFILTNSDIQIESSSNVIKLTGNVEVFGNLTVSQDIESTTGNIQAAVDVKAAAGTIKLTTHTHIGNLGAPTGPALPG